MLDVLVVGAGPAGSVAATVVARAGARVRLVDRAMFPRDKLCGDTVNPGTLAILRRLHLASEVESRGLQVEGMRVTGENGVAVEGRYPSGVFGRAIVRRDLDWLLLQQALAAGAQFDPGVTVLGPVVENSAVMGAASIVRGVRRELRATVTIAADGRRSPLAFGLRLARHPPRPRRWAIGAYFETAAVSGPTLGEMHVRSDRYIGVAPLPDGLTNVCLVKRSRPGDAALRSPERTLSDTLDRDRFLHDRFAGARPIAPPTVLGPLAVDADTSGIEGLLLAGDAAGFIDPMTGDGLRFAVRGGEQAAHAALAVLAGGWSGVHARLAALRRAEFDGKRRFNRALRAVVGSRQTVWLAAATARIAPSLLRTTIAYAGDCW